MIRGGVEGRERLRLLARAMWPVTRPLLDRSVHDTVAEAVRQAAIDSGVAQAGRAQPAG